MDVVDAVDVFRRGWVEPEDLRPSLGDIIDFNRDVYTHHAIYVGNGNVVHKWAAGHVPFCVAEIRLESLKSRSLHFLKQGWMTQFINTIWVIFHHYVMRLLTQNNTGVSRQ